MDPMCTSGLIVSLVFPNGPIVSLVVPNGSTVSLMVSYVSNASHGPIMSIVTHWDTLDPYGTNRLTMGPYFFFLYLYQFTTFTITLL